MPTVRGPWAAEEEKILIEMFDKGATTKDLAAALGRTQESVSARRLALAKQRPTLKLRIRS